MEKKFGEFGYEYKEKLTNKGMSNIYICEKDNHKYIIKVPLINSEKKKENIKKLHSLVGKLNGVNIMKIKTMFSSNKFYLIMEKNYFDFEFFLNYLLIGNFIDVSINTYKFPWLYNMNSNVICFFLSEMFNGLKILYEHNLVHGNIQPSNLLINNSFNLKISDFCLISKAKSNFELENLNFCYNNIRYNNHGIENDIILNYEDCFKLDYYRIGLIIYFIFFRNNLIKEDSKNTIDCRKCFIDASNEISKSEFDEKDKENYIKGSEEKNIEMSLGFKFIDKKIGELVKHLISKKISDIPNIFEILDNDSLNKYKIKIKKIYDINMNKDDGGKKVFIENSKKLFIEFQKPEYKRKRKRKKYLLVY